MKLTDIKIGESVTREVWLHRGLFIKRIKNTTFKYQGQGHTIVSPGSTVRDYNDYMYCDSGGNILKNKKEVK